MLLKDEEKAEVCFVVHLDAIEAEAAGDGHYRLESVAESISCTAVFQNMGTLFTLETVRGGDNAMLGSLEYPPFSLPGSISTLDINISDESSYP